MEIAQNIAYLWLIAGSALVIAEFILVAGVGMLFAGLGALFVGLLVQTGVVNDILYQWVIFFATTVIWALILWKPLSRFQLGKGERGFSDMIGHKAILINTIAQGELGKSRWSGTIMNTKLAPEAPANLPEGSEVLIVAVEGNTLIVK